MQITATTFSGLEEILAKEIKLFIVVFTRLELLYESSYLFIPLRQSTKTIYTKKYGRLTGQR